MTRDHDRDDTQTERRTEPDRRNENSDRREHDRYNPTDASRNDRRRGERRRSDDN